MRYGYQGVQGQSGGSHDVGAALKESTTSEVLKSESGVSSTVEE